VVRIGIDGRYIQDHYPGIGRYTYSLISALAPLATDESFVVLTNPDTTNTRHDLDALAAYPNVRLVPVGIPTSSLTEQVRLPALISRLSLSLLHSPYYVHPYRLRVPTLLTVYDTIPARFPHYFSLPTRVLIRVLKRLALRTAAHCVAISNSTKADFARLHGVDPGRMTAIPLAADGCFRPAQPAAIASVRKQYRLPDSYALYVGVNKPHKNLVRLIDAWSSLEGSADQVGHRQTVLVLAGQEDTRYPQARRRAEELGLTDSVRFLGAVSESTLPALYSGSVVFVFPSLYEGFGLPVLEAMACGTPVACSNSSSLPELVGDAALTFEPTDVASIAETLLLLLGDTEVRSDMSRRGLDRARRFSWTETARRTLALYRAVVAKRD
jgi:alpha-1,3-rhamnosyl/mannosyltransferase